MVKPRSINAAGVQNLPAPPGFVARALDIGAGALIFGLQRLDLDLGAGERGARLLDRDAIGLRVDAEQQVALVYRPFSRTATSTIRPPTSALTDTLSCWT